MKANLTIAVGGIIRRVAPGDLKPEYAAKLIDEIAAEPDGPIVLTVRGFTEWPADARTVFFELWGAAKQSRIVTVKQKKTSYQNALDFALANLVGEPSQDEASDWLTATAVAVAECYAQSERAVCAEAVVKHLQTVGFGGITDAEFLARVAEAAGESVAGAAGGGPNPTVLAEDFVQRHRDAAPKGLVAADARTLHFFGGTFYEWDRAWKEIKPEEVRAMVTRDLQDHSGVTRVTTRLVSDVLLNLQGLCVVCGADQPLPFHIDEYGPPTRSTRRKMLVFRNGMIDLEVIAAGAEPKLLPHDPRWFGTSVLPFDFDSDATCGKFKKFLRRVLERDPDTGKALQKGDRRLQVLQEWFGYTLLCDARFQKFLLMVGEGSNGKGVIQNLWVRMLGTENVAHVSLDQLGGRFGLQPLLGKLANICGDLCEIDAVAEGALKRLTGEDNIMVDKKNQAPVTMAPTVKLVFGTNSLPRFSDKSRGVWRRLVAMAFRVIIPEAEQDELLADKLEAELPGILNWALVGLRRLLQQGQFSACVVCAEAAKRHQLDCDPVAQFMDEIGIHPPPDDGAVRRILKDDLYQKYREWCEGGGYLALSRNRFNRQVGKLPGVQEYRSPQAEPDGKRPYYWTSIGMPLVLPVGADSAEADEDDLAEEAA